MLLRFCKERGLNPPSQRASLSASACGTSAGEGLGAVDCMVRSPCRSECHVRTAFFTGEPFTATSPSGTKFKMTFTQDGKVTREPLELSDTKDIGTWKLSAKGFSTTWTRSKPNCFLVTPLADNKWSDEKIATSIATRVAVWSK